MSFLETLLTTCWTKKSGFRWGKIGLRYGGEKTRKSLSKTKLIENGVDPEVIKESYKESKPYTDARFIPFL